MTLLESSERFLPTEVRLRHEKGSVLSVVASAAELLATLVEVRPDAIDIMDIANVMSDWGDVLEADRRWRTRVGAALAEIGMQAGNSFLTPRRGSFVLHVVCGPAS